MATLPALWMSRTCGELPTFAVRFKHARGVTRRPHPTPIPVSPNRPGLVWPSAVDPAGVLGPTRAQSRTSRWRRTSSGYYVPADLDPALAVEQRIVSAARVALGHGVVTGWAALRWMGAKWLDEPCVPIAVPRTGLRKQSGIAPSAERLEEDDVLIVDGIAVTSALRSVTFAARHAQDLAAAVNALDRAAAADLVSLAEVASYTRDRLAGTAGVDQLRAALTLAVENSWSPMETEMRLLWRRIGLVDVRCNAPVFDRCGRHVGTPDLLDPARGVGGEYDSADHLDRTRRNADIKREAALRRTGLEYVEMMAPDRRDPSDFLRRTSDAVQRANPATWTWTLEPPPWWKPTETVDQRRSLSARERERLLRWQR